jgi:hypothetical protein
MSGADVSGLPEFEPAKKAGGSRVSNSIGSMIA